MLAAKPSAVVASYHRCRSDARFVDTFYDLFLARSPEVAQKFEHTDFERQKMMLRESLLEMISFEQDLPGAHEEIAKLAQRHKELEVTREMYVMWLDALCEAVERHDPEYTPEIGDSWRRAMQKGIDWMQAW